MKKEDRVITQAGDSSDGEEQSKLEFQKQFGQKNESYTKYLNNKVENPSNKNVMATKSVSFIVEDIGNRLLQNNKIREKYVNIKDPLFLRQQSLEAETKLLNPQQQAEHINKLKQEQDRLKQLITKRNEFDKQIGKNWSLIFRLWDKQKETISGQNAKTFYDNVDYTIKQKIMQHSDPKQLQTAENIVQ